MLKQGLDVYLPLVDDDAVDAMVKRPDGRIFEVQVKARSRTAKLDNGALSAGIAHEVRQNYWFVFYSGRLDTIWVMSSREFIAEATQNKNGINVGKRTLHLNGTKINKTTAERREYVKDRYLKYMRHDFARLLHDN